MTALPAYVQELSDGLYAVDTGLHRPRFDAAYLMVDSGRAAFIDTGTQHAVPRLLEALAAVGVPRGALDWVIPTHVHLDHAGGVGALMRELPDAQLLVHARGLRHMVDPGALFAGALAVYGAEEMQRTYGAPIGVDAQRAQATHDGMVVQVGRRALRFADTPGHARHHHCIWDERTRGWFTGDTFGVSYREFDDAERGPSILPSSVPSQFDPDALRESVARLLHAQPRCMYLTHYGRVDDVQRLGVELSKLLQRTVEIGLAGRDVPDRHRVLREALRDLYVAAVQAHGCALAPAEIEALLEMDIELNAQGLGGWLDRGNRAKP